MWLGPELFVFISDPKYVEVILSSNKLLDKGNNYKYLNSWIGNGLLTSSGTQWRTHRKIITPTFHFSILEDFMDIFNSNGRKLVEKLQKEVNGPEFDLYTYVTLCALDIICETAMGIKINAQDGGSADFVEATRGNFPWLGRIRVRDDTATVKRTLRIQGVLDSNTARLAPDFHPKGLNRKHGELNTNKDVTTDPFLEFPGSPRKHSKREQMVGRYHMTNEVINNKSEMAISSTPAHSVMRMTRDGRKTHVIGHSLLSQVLAPEQRLEIGYNLQRRVVLFLEIGEATLECGQYPSSHRFPSTAHQYVFVYTYSSVIKSKNAEFIEAKKSEKKNVSRDKQEDDFGVKKRRAFLDMLMETVQDGDLLTDDELREEVDTFMFEGHDTTSSGISFALSSLALNQDVQDKAAEELKAIFGDSNRDATFRDIQEMKYLEMVIKEAQRLFPSVPMFVRNLKEDVKVDGYTLPKGANVTIVNIIMHRDASLFPDPEKFDPERFSPENSQGRHPYQYVPFSAGPRNCIGLYELV
uniref:Cytochrome P450 n=1 Tax=Timema bartmani TaxID=61472 RepID=A0A7R9F7I3_9NEOP|nr:unnamed protein product [Timema bartmani]